MSTKNRNGPNTIATSSSESASTTFDISSFPFFRMGVRSLFLSTSLFGFCMWKEHPDYVKWIDSKYAGKYEYLTYLGVAVTIGTIVVSSVADMLSYFAPNKEACLYKRNVDSFTFKGHEDNSISKKLVNSCSVSKWYKLSKKAAELRNWLLAISFPIETLITIFYWSLRVYDRTLLSSAFLISRGYWTPIESDISNHLLPFFYVWIELLLFSKYTSKPFIRKWIHKLVLIAVNGAYMAWSHYLFLQNKKWVYPLLGKLTTGQHFGLVAATSSFTVISYWMGTALLGARHT